MPRRFAPTGLPIEASLQSLAAALAERGVAVLRAEPGAGKTTVVPLALLDQDWLGRGRILMLQPRRVAARASAERMASLLGEKAGRTVGYRVALESRVGPDTRIEVLTEGILGRMIQDDPELSGVGLLIFDEFHERSQHADLGLALALEARASLRPDLRILVMSATIDGPALAVLPGDGGPTAPLVECPGRSFPVALRWCPALPGPDGQAPDWWQDARAFLRLVAERALEALEATAGDILVFLPGQGEIRRVAQELGERLPPGCAEILSLHGSLPPADQARVLQPGSLRRVILATNVAETSLTLPGVGLVIDSGLVRVNRFDSRLGMDRLVTERVSLASARQRQGRAGRVQSGACWRLWPEGEKLADYLPPEIERADLSDFALAAAAWGAASPQELRLLSQPAPALWRHARDLLARLGALDPGERLSPLGRDMAGLGTHPRLARMILSAGTLGQSSLGLAWAVAALLQDRDPLGTADSGDFLLRLQLLPRSAARPAASSPASTALLDRCREYWERRFPAGKQLWPDAAALPRLLSRLCAWAWPDRLGRLESVAPDRQNRLVATYLLSNGRQACLSGPDAQHPPAWLVAVDAEAAEPAVAIRLWAAFPADSPLEDQVPELVGETPAFRWEGFKPRASSQRRIGQIVLAERPLKPDQLDPAAFDRACLERLRLEQPDGSHRLAELPWSPAGQALLARCRWAHAAKPADWPDPSPAALAQGLGEWLLPQLRRDGQAIVDPGLLDQALDLWLGWDRRKQLDRLVPTHLTVPSGSRRPLEYPDPALQAGAPPVLSVRIQEIFGMAEQPRVLGIPVQLELLSPAQRPLQITTDLASFWARTYPEIRKELRGRYPRHYWPENPLEAEPTARAKPRGQ